MQQSHIRRFFVIYLMFVSLPTVCVRVSMCVSHQINSPSSTLLLFLSLI